ncbi:MAG: bifunctional DNA-formamidopyrimidine glycosylase/DNA-(apurinic or apyrimidinic site) lyase [Rhizobiaceae bacterium]
MPELPEVETVRRGLAPVLEGSKIRKLIQNRPDLRFPFPSRFADRVQGQTITALSRRAKYLLVHLSGGHVLVCHLGMSGSFRIETTAMTDNVPAAYEKNRKHDHVILHVGKDTDADTKVIYNDPRRFGFMLLIKHDELNLHPIFANLGVEPTGNTLDGETIGLLFEGKRAPLKAALLDQRLIAGLGNIYVCEALWRAGLDPRKSAESISGRGKRRGEVRDRLASAIRDVIRDAIDSGGSSLRDHVQTDGSLGYFQHRFATYDREGEACMKTGCHGQVERIVQSGRSTFFCRLCQK